MDESVFRDFIRKSMFKERLREVVAEEILRVQAQVHLHEIALFDRAVEVRRVIERDLVKGDAIE